MGELSIQRKALDPFLTATPENVQQQWLSMKPAIESWWSAYKAWEAKDTFDKAFTQSRMTVRTFAGGVGAFSKQVSKEFNAGSIKLTSSTRDEITVRIYADSHYTPLSKEDLARHDQSFHKTDERYKYRANRGIDSSAFANPTNFETRESKYAAGLHDLSASLLNPALPIFDQIHNSDRGGKINFRGEEIEGAHFSFVPLSKEEDQLVLYLLVGLAKKLKTVNQEFYQLVRSYRAKMTRVKLAQEFDMAIGYSAVPVARPGPGSPAYKLRYGLGQKTTITGPQGQQTVHVDRDVYQARRDAALKFKSIIGKRDAKNEIVLALRQHNGPYPVYAIRNNDILECYDIGGGQMRRDGRTITQNGVMNGR